MAQLVNSPAVRETCVRSLGWEDLMEKGKATYSSILAWRIPWTIVHGITKSWTWLRDFHFTSKILHIICTLHNNTCRSYYYSPFINNETEQWYSGKTVLLKKKKVWISRVCQVPQSKFSHRAWFNLPSWNNQFIKFLNNNLGCNTPLKQDGANQGDLATS